MNEQPTDQRLKDLHDGHPDPNLEAGSVSSSGGMQLASSSRAGGQPANLQGYLERGGFTVVGEQIHDQHQHRDELLAHGGVQSPGMPSSRSLT